MAKRLFMTTADYVTIALSPALVMLLVGSLVYFLIEVLYVGEYEARLLYVFGLFVFAAVLVARISMESGAEYASFFAIPLGLATFAVLMKFVEHPGPFSWLINIGLMCIVWWCAHKLTWDCTLIDDDEDSSGEGLLRRVGIDDAAAASDSPPAENELLADKDAAGPWWRRLLKPKGQKHTPGVWVLYFSLAALPLFGMGQHWVPAVEVGRRRYVFSLLIVYVASALALLVTTSFLGLRRYLRQRRIEMPAPMAATWVAIGAVLIVIVMLLAALVPRPHAEYAISQVPWQATSPAGQSSSRYASGRDGSEEFDRSGDAIREDAPPGDAVREDASGEPAASDEGQPSGTPGGERDASGKNQSGGQSGNEPPADGTRASESSDQDAGSKSSESPRQDSQAATDAQQTSEPSQRPPGGGTAKVPMPQHPADEQPYKLPKIPEIPLGLLAGALKLVFYTVVAILAAVFVWRNRHALAQAVRDVLRQLRDLLARLFGRSATAPESVDEAAPVSLRRLRPFADYRNPFDTGDYRGWPPEEIVRYTFEAFEAWARDAGHPRSPDQTPAELVHVAVPPQTPLDDAARNMTRLYSQIAYASGRVSPAAAESLRELWSLMQSQSPRLLSI